MNPTPTPIERELYSIYAEQFDRYWSWYEQKAYSYYDYLLLSAEHIVFAMETYMEKSEKVRLLIAQYEGLIAMLKLELEKDLNNKEEYYKLSPRNKKYYPQKKQRVK